MWKKKERWTAAALLLAMVVVTGLCWYILYIRQQFYDEGTRNLLETYEQVDKAFTIFSRSNWNMLNEWGKSLQAANEEGLAEGRSGSLSYWLEGKSYYLVYQPVGFQDLSIVGIVGRDMVDSGMRKIQNATILLLAGLFFCAGIVLVHGVRTDARLRVEEKERALRQEGEARQQMEDLANTDGLTGLYNERYFDALLKENELNRTPFVLFYLDLDRFKPVNDRYGHDVGDQLLKEVASRLRGCVRESDAVFRIGGDEFALIVNGAVTEGFCKSRVEKIKAAIREPYRLKDAEVQVGTSCGCAVYPCDSDDVRAIRILADHRMYEDKQRSGRSCE